MGVQGVGHMEDEAEPNPIGPTPWCLFGFFLGSQKEARRRGGETPSNKRNRSIIVPSSVWPSASHLSLSPLAFGHLPLTRGVGPQGEGVRAAGGEPPL